MPELPEVQTVVDSLIAAAIIGKTVQTAKVLWPKTIVGDLPRSFCRRIKGRIITSVWRRGKYIILDLDANLHLLIHLRMTGHLLISRKENSLSKHIHVTLQLDDGRYVYFHDTRKFGRMHLIQDTSQILDKLGVEPLSAQFTAKWLKQCLKNHRRRLKPFLLDQTILAGLGNIYVDEALWRAKVHPLRNTATLTEPESRALHRAIRDVLRRGIRNNGTSLGTGKNNFMAINKRQGNNQHALNVFRRTGLPCPKCRTPIQRIRVGQRSTHLCEKCQKEPAESI